MKADSWIDLAGHGMDLKVVRVPRGAHYLVVCDTPRASGPGMGIEANRSRLLEVGLRQPVPGTMSTRIALYIKETGLDADGWLEAPPDIAEWKRLFPRARVVDFDVVRDFLDQAAVSGSPVPPRRPSTQDVPGLTDPRHPDFRARLRREADEVPRSTGLDAHQVQRLKALAASNGTSVRELLDGVVRLFAELPSDAQAAFLDAGAGHSPERIARIEAGLAQVNARLGREHAGGAAAPADGAAPGRRP